MYSIVEHIGDTHLAVQPLFELAIVKENAQKDLKLSRLNLNCEFQKGGDDLIMEQLGTSDDSEKSFIFL